MKKLITMVLALAMLTMMSTTAFAAAPDPATVITGGTLAITELGHNQKRLTALLNFVVVLESMRI